MLLKVTRTKSGTFLWLLFCSDSAVSFPIQKGVIASRSKVKYFRHNDMGHLEQLLEESRKIDEKVTWIIFGIPIIDILTLAHMLVVT